MISTIIMKVLHSLLLFSFVFLSCKTKDSAPSAAISSKKIPEKNIQQFDSTTKTIHVFVALCDNKYQGVVPVPAKIGNGQDAGNNLYWGCGYGVKSYFIKSASWKLVKKYKTENIRLERLVFKHIKQKYFLVADAYDGKFIKQCSIDFFRSCAGQIKDTLHISNTIIGINGNAKLVSYTGHDGLMDFSLDENFENADGKKRDAVILACKSKRFFSSHLAKTKANPLVWSTGLMSPEAYTLHDAISSYISNESGENIRTAAAKAYAKYQHCSLKAAMNLLVSGY